MMPSDEVANIDLEWPSAAEWAYQHGRGTGEVLRDLSMAVGKCAAFITDVRDVLQQLESGSYAAGHPLLAGKIAILHNQADKLHSDPTLFPKGHTALAMEPRR